MYRNNIIRNRPFTDDKNEIVKSLSKKEKKLLGASLNEEWIVKEAENKILTKLAKSFVTKNGDIPVSFIEIWTDGGRTGQIALATRNDPKYRGKGYASKEVEKAIKWTERYGYKNIDELQWIAEKTNEPSNQLAKKFGFIKDEGESKSGDYNFYYRKIKNESS